MLRGAKTPGCAKPCRVTLQFATRNEWWVVSSRQETGGGGRRGNNDETFDKFDAKSWNETVQKMDAVLTELEKMVENADEAKLKAIAPTIANINSHNAYHIGEIVMVRKEQGSWDPKKGVN